MLLDWLAALLDGPWWVVCAVIGAAVGALVPSAAARRTLTRPVAMALESETLVLASVLADLRRFPYVSTMSASDFAANHHHNIWAALLDVLGPEAVVADGATDADCAAHGERLAARQDQILAALAARLVNTSQPETDRARALELLAHGRTHKLGVDVTDEEKAAADAATVTAAEDVIACGNDRNRLSGPGLVLPTGDPNSLDADAPPLARVWMRPTRGRRIGSAAVTGLVAAMLPAMVQVLPGQGLSHAFAALALVALLVTSVVISLVDLDTLYIDTPVWLGGTIACWVLATAAAFSAGNPRYLLYGAAMVVGVVVLFEGTNLVFKLLRGMDGQGFGDTLIIVATVGIPPALTGDYRTGYVSVMAGLLAGALGWFAFRIAGKVTRHTPFAFGPWLSVGWVVAMAWYVIDATFLLSMN